jgi:hypothetical protein
LHMSNHQSLCGNLLPIYALLLTFLYVSLANEVA